MTTPRHADPLRSSLLAALLLAGALVLSVADVVDPDLWGHVHYGRDVLAEGRLPVTATHTFTASDQPWINHEILSEIVFAWVADRAGGAGLLALKCLLGLGVLGVMIVSSTRQGASLAVTCVVVMLAASNVSPGWTLRPQLLTYVFFAFMIGILDVGAPGRIGRPGRGRMLWFLPPLFAVWANTHGGFVAGLGVLAVYLGGRAIEALRRDGRRALGKVAGYAGVASASALATLANPYGVELLLWLAHDLVPPRPEITEWGPLLPLDLQFVPFVALAGLTVAGWLGSRRPLDPTKTVLLGAGVWQAVAHARHPPLFAIMVAFWLPPHVEALWRRLRPSAGVSSAPVPERPLGVIRAAAWVTTLALAITLGVRSRTLWVSKSAYPVEAFEYMAAHGLIGKLVVHFDWAQYAIAAFAPETTVAFDGRFRTCYPQEVADMHFDFILGNPPGQRWRSPQSPPVDGARVLELGRPDLVLVSRRYPHAVETMEQHGGDWSLLYQDALAQLWGRRTKYDDPARAEYLPPAERAISDRPQTGVVPWPALPHGAS